MRRRLSFRALLVLLIVVACGGLLTLAVLLLTTDLFEREAGRFAFGKKCHRPRMVPRQTVRTAFKINCLDGGADWTYAKDGRVHINYSVAPADVRCAFVPLLRMDDYNYYLGDATKNIANRHPIHTDFFLTKCRSVDRYRDQIHATISRRQITVATQRGESAAAPSAGRPSETQHNVMILILDSLSRVNWEAYLPQAHDYFVRSMGGTIFKSYNIVGDGTTPNLLALLTGHKEEELYESRKSYRSARPVDDYPWIWKRYSESGYVTQWGEDGAEFGTFQYRLSGFTHQPVDHYMRTYYMKAEEMYNTQPFGCIGALKRHRVKLDWAKQLFEVYRNQPKFSVILHSELTHENNFMVSAMDEDLVDFLRFIHTSPLAKNTILILMSDHGHRYSNSRATAQGKYEERLPYFGIALAQELLPHSLNWQQNLHHNSDQLITPFDVHTTLLHILYMLKPHKLPSFERGKSLLQKISTTRNCPDVEIEPHWCGCLAWREISRHSPEANLVVSSAVYSINSALSVTNNKCNPIDMYSIQSAEEYKPHDELLRFDGSSDPDGRFPLLLGSTFQSEFSYRITFIAIRTGALFEATGTRNIKQNNFVVRLSDISRINEYRNQSSCISHIFPHLRKFCHCRGMI